MIGLRSLARLSALATLLGLVTCQGSDPATPGGPGNVAGSGSGGTTGGVCAHDPCVFGVALVSTCEPCAGTVCAQDSHCCDGEWDDVCVAAAVSLCGDRCNGGTAGGGAGGTDGDAGRGGGPSAGAGGAGGAGGDAGGAGGGEGGAGGGEGGAGGGEGGSAGSSNGAGGSAGSSGETLRLRLMASNQVGGSQKYGVEASRVFQALRPDVVMMQEFNVGDNSTSAIRTYVDQAFGTDYAIFRETGASIPNGFVSRYPILEAGEWNDTNVGDRDFAYARIGLPNGRDLWAVSVHLLTSSSTSRLNEATEFVNYINGQVPAADLLVLGGDFNTGSRTEPCVNKLGELFVMAGPYPRDQQNNTNTNNSRQEPYDWLVADPDLNPLKTAVVVGGSTFPDGLVFDSRVFTPLSAVAPVLSNDSSTFQHMGVVREFLVPAAN